MQNQRQNTSSISHNNDFLEFERNMRNQMDNTLNSALTQNQSATQQRVQGYEAQTRNVNQTADERARQAYVQRLRSTNNMPRLLQAQGITGGAAESTVARMSNNFDNIQFGIMQNRDNELFEIQNRVNAANAAGAQNAANIRNQHSMQQLDLERDLKNMRVQAADRQQAEWERRRQQQISMIPQHYNDFQAFINQLEGNDPYNIRGEVIMARNAKMAGQNKRDAAEAERARQAEAQRVAQEAEAFERYLSRIPNLPSQHIWNHMMHYEPHSEVYNRLWGYFLAAQNRERQAR